MPMRSFSLNDPEAYDIMCRPRPPQDRWPRGAAPVKVVTLESADGERRLESDVEADAERAFGEWLWHFEAGRIGPQTQE